MSEIKWHKRYLEMARLVSTWSKDPNKQVGCVLTDEINRVVSTGFNGPPRGLDNYDMRDRLALTIHAEVNALLFRDRLCVTCYTYPYWPCSHCTAQLAQSGIIRIVSIERPSEKWRPDLTLRLCNDLNIELITFPKSFLS